ncbi:MAG TPA: AAA family ATPase [Burkholderiaceae bacterium]|nr:AAA family ATPase [Burkholderiaceae bacterium]
MSTSISKIQKRQRLRKMLMAAAMVCIVGAGALLVNFNSTRHINQSFTQFTSDLDAGLVKKITVLPSRDSGNAQVALKDGRHYGVEMPVMNLEAASGFSKKGVEVEFDAPMFDHEKAISMLLMLVLLGGVGFVVSQPVAFDLPFSRKRRDTNVRFSDVAGADEAKKNLVEIAAYLKSPDIYEAIGATFPRGVILYGDPGTGKTLLAKALAGEAGANFIATNGSEFGSMFIGVSSMKIKRLFAKARSMAPCVLFIDEIDAIGGKRMDDGSAAGREMSSTLNQLLVQMDGFDTNNGVIIVAATNRIDSLDPALLRSGRFDRRIQLGKPNLREREEILKIHGRKIKTENSMNYHEVARHTIGFSGADLANLVNQAALIAVRDHQPQVVLENVLRARNVMLMGEERRSTMSMLDDPTRLRLAIHECGHTIAAMAGNQDPVSAVSIVPRGGSLGQTFIAPEKDQFLLSRDELVNRLNILVAGRVAEEMFADSISTGADDDIARASEIALNIVCRHGMSEFGLMKITEHSSDRMRYEAECRAAQIIDDARKKTVAILSANRHVMEVMSARLVEKEELNQEELREFKELIVDFEEPLSRVA